MKELLNTELGYAKSLDLLIHHYVKPLRINSTSPHAFILPSDVDDISFYYIHEYYFNSL